MVIGLIALGSVLYFVVASQAQNETVFERVGVVDDTSLALKRIQDHLRQAYMVAPTPTTGSTSTASLTYRGVVVTGTGASRTFALHDFRLDCSQPGSVAGTYACVETDQTTGAAVTQLTDLVGPMGGTFTVNAPPSASAGLPRVDIAVTHRIQRNGANVKLTSSVQPRNCQTTGLVSGACPFP